MKKKHSWKSPNSNNLNIPTKVGSISVEKEILEDSIYMTKGIEEYIKNDEQYALLKAIKNARCYDRVMINGLDSDNKNMIIVGQNSDGTGEQIVLNNWKSMFEDKDTKDVLIALKLEYTMRYEFDTTFTPVGTAREIYGTDDDTPLCVICINNKGV